ncbi:MAG: DUF1801 domain-containing protein [Undibacterium umbellatum]|uniref:DUF1801 domain-containing protein n=1 Tax=Undibacterium umbellatum TaxID=2762300 RepID=UPI003BB6C836
MTENKTKATDNSVDDYIAAIADETRRQDCEILIQLMSKATKQPAVMWGNSIVGFGNFHYRYESGREGDICLIGFSSRKGDISLYGLFAATRHVELVANLGKSKSGKGCLYIRRLSEVDLQVMETLINEAADSKNRLGC